MQPAVSHHGQAQQQHIPTAQGRVASPGPAAKDDVSKSTQWMTRGASDHKHPSCRAGCTFNRQRHQEVVVPDPYHSARWEDSVTCCRSQTSVSAGARWPTNEMYVLSPSLNSRNVQIVRLCRNYIYPQELACYTHAVRVGLPVSWMYSTQAAVSLRFVDDPA